MTENNISQFPVKQGKVIRFPQRRKVISNVPVNLWDRQQDLKAGLKMTIIIPAHLSPEQQAQVLEGRPRCAERLYLHNISPSPDPDRPKNAS